MPQHAERHTWPTVKRWVDRHLAGESMQNRSSRPSASPNKTPEAVAKRCVSLRMRLCEGPVHLAARLDITSSTVHRSLTTPRLKDHPAQRCCQSGLFSKA